jgi:hypothetical protein
LQQQQVEIATSLKQREKLNNELLFLNKEIQLLTTNQEIQAIASKLGSVRCLKESSNHLGMRRKQNQKFAAKVL